MSVLRSNTRGFWMSGLYDPDVCVWSCVVLSDLYHKEYLNADMRMKQCSGVCGRLWTCRSVRTVYSA